MFKDFLLKLVWAFLFRRAGQIPPYPRSLLGFVWTRGGQGVSLRFCTFDDREDRGSGLEKKTSDLTD